MNNVNRRMVYENNLLPKRATMRYCRKCLTTDLRPNSLFNENGVCIACQFSNKSLTKSPKVRLMSLSIRLNWLEKPGQLRRSTVSLVSVVER